MEVSGQLHAPAALPPGINSPGTYYIGDWVEPKAGLDAVDERKSCPAASRTPAFQPVACRYADWAIPSLLYLKIIMYINTLFEAICYFHRRLISKESN
jgi:hypothetical protein